MTRPTVTAAMVAHGRSVAEARLSPSGDAIAFSASAWGKTALVVVRLGPHGGEPELAVTTEPVPAAAHPYGGGTFDWLPDGSGLVFAGRDDCLHVVAADGGPARLVAEPSSQGGELSSPAVAPDGRWVAYVQEGGRSTVLAAPLDPAAGLPVRLSPHSGADFALDPAWSPNGWVAWHEWDVPAMPWDSSRIVAVPFAHGPAGDRITVVGGAGISVGQPRFSPDGRWLACTSDQSGWSNVWVVPGPGTPGGPPRPLHPQEHEHAGATWGPGQRTYAWSPDSAQVAFTPNEGGFGSLLVAGRDGGPARSVARAVHIALSWAGGRIGAIRTGARTPNQVVVYDADTAERTVVAHGSVGGWEAADLPEPEVVHWRSADGADVHGRLYRPRRSAGPLDDRPPMIVNIHGGPTGQTQVVFTGRFAYWLDRGWAVLVPDHRGSTGWGRAFTQAMAGGWGETDVEDVAAGVRHAVAAGWCDPRRVVVMGGSAGGFTVLGLLARHPELWAAGVELSGPADLLELDETTHRYERHYLHSIVGPLPEAVERYRERSPVLFADRIMAPLLILQGSDDHVVPVAQSRAIADRLQRLGRPVELHVYEGEGHGWGRAETVIDELQRCEDFLRRHVLRWRP